MYVDRSIEGIRGGRGASSSQESEGHRQQRRALGLANGSSGAPGSPARGGVLDGTPVRGLLALQALREAEEHGAHARHVPLELGRRALREALLEHRAQRVGYREQVAAQPQA